MHLEDPANDVVPYECGIDIRELVSLEKVMDELKLGPNGGLMYCMEYIEKNIDWLYQRIITKFKDYYLLFDCPGQAELYTHHTGVRNILTQFQKWSIRLTCVNLVDSYYCSVPSTYVSALLLSLSTMLHLELPHVNVLSKIDLVETHGKLPFNLEFFTDATNLKKGLKHYLDAEPFGMRYSNLNKALCELLDEFGLVSFLALNIQEKESVYEVIKAVDKSNGYVYGGLTSGNENIFTVADAGTRKWNYEQVAELQEKYMPKAEADQDLDKGWEFPS